MLKRLLEQVLLKFLAPYVENLSPRLLRLGTWSGSVELQDLRVKPEFLELLGLQGIKIRAGKIGRIHLKVPWKSLLTGRLHIAVDQLYLEAHETSPTPEAMRAAKSGAVDLRMEQLRDLLEQTAASEAGQVIQEGFGVRIARRILNNLDVNILRVAVWLVSTTCPMACGVELPALQVLSTNENFQEQAQDVIDEGPTMYKLLRLNGLGLRLSAAGSSDVQSATYVISPIGASIQLTHAPISHLLQLNVEWGSGEANKVVLQLSQWRHLQRVLAELGDKAAKLQAALVPLEAQSVVNSDKEVTALEYGRLYNRKLWQQQRLLQGNAPALTEEDQTRLELLEAALPVRLLAQQRLLAHQSLDSAKAEKPLSWVASWACCSAPKSMLDQEVSLLEEDLLKRLRRDMADVSAVEEVEPPDRVRARFVFLELTVELIDDRWTDYAQQELLKLVLPTASMRVEVDRTADPVGREAAQWGVYMDLGPWQARHAGRQVLLHRHRHRDGARASFAEETNKAPAFCDNKGEVSCVAAKLVLRSTVEEEFSLLKVCFDSTPFEVHLLPGMVGRIIEFFTPPEDVQEAAQLVAASAVASASEADMATAAQMGLDVVHKVKEQIPDRLALDLKFAAPIVRAPVDGRGDIVASLGQLWVATSRPCDYSNLSYKISLSDTVLSAVSQRKEHFNIIEPVPVQVTVDMFDMDGERNVEVQVSAETLALSLAPEALQILLFFPETIDAILSETLPGHKYTSEVLRAASHERASTPERDSTPLLVFPPQPTLADLSKLSMRSNSSLTAAEVRSAPLRSQSFLETMTPSFRKSITELAASRDGMVGTQSFKPLRRCATCEVHQQVTSATSNKSIDSSDQEQLRVSVTLIFAGITLTLADSLVSLLRLQLELPKPGLLLKTTRLPQLLEVEVSSASLELEGFSRQSGQWEPLIEPFTFGLCVRCPPESHGPMATGVDVFGHTPLLVNLTPTLLRKLTHAVELVTSAVNSVHSSEAPPKERNVEAKYRAINICERPVELEFRSRQGTVVKSLRPTGSEWEELDPFILPCFATAVVLRVPGGRDSEPLQLELDGMIVVPGYRLVAQLFTPGEGQNLHRLLLLTPPLRLHNLTSTALDLRFHDGVRQEVLPATLEPTMVCDAALLGFPALGDGHETLEGWTAQDTLPPNSLCAVPDGAMVLPSGADAGAARAFVSAKFISTKSAEDDGFSKPVEVGLDVQPYKAFQCKGPATLGDKLIEWEADTQTFGSDASLIFTTVKLRPPILALNAVPLGTLHLAYAQHHKGAKPVRWCEVAMHGLSSRSLYDVSSSAGGNCLSLRARLGDGATPWSPTAVVHWEQLAVDSTLQTLTVHKSKSGAPVGITVESVEGYKLRFSCPFWFVDCSGIQKPLVLDVHRHARKLPRQGGLSLLPQDCLEEEVELVLSAERGELGSAEGIVPTKNQQTGVRLPPNWSALFFEPQAARPLVFCVQTDTINPNDVFGANCRAVVLRPRLMLTNASRDDIEVRHSFSNEQFVLRAETSREFHWRADRSDELPSTELSFRPRATEPPRQWSSAVVCADMTAGSTPFLLPEMGKRGSGGTVDVWSVEIAPVRGALAVSFKHDSNFVAMNKAPPTMRSRGAAQPLLEMHVRPIREHCHQRGSDVIRPGEMVSEVSVLPGFQEPFGWPDPFGGTRSRAVEVIVDDQTHHIRDVRQTLCKALDGGLVLRVLRRGVQTLLLLEADEQMPLGLDGGCLQLSVRLCQVGVSLIEEAPEFRELLYVHLEPVDLVYRDTDNDAHELKLSINTAQVDCQLPGRLEEDPECGRRYSLDGHLRAKSKWRPAVVLRNSGQHPFLELSLARSATSSGDIVLPAINLSLDGLDVHIDDQWLEALVRWHHAADGPGAGSEQTLSLAQVVALVSGEAEYAPPPLPSVVQVETLSISKVKLMIWCRLKLASLRFLPEYVLHAVRAVSFSNHFSLSGATVVLRKKAFPSHRGSLEDFWDALVAEYGRSVVANIFSLLHKSSLLNLPRVPLKIGSGMVDGLKHVADPFVSPTSGLGHAKMMRSTTMSASTDNLGVLEHKGVLRRALESFSPCRTRPSAVVNHNRPVCRAKGSRRRAPRLMLAAECGLRPWSSLEAAVLAQLGREVTGGAHEVLALTKVGCYCTLLLFYTHKLLVTCINTAGISLCAPVVMSVPFEPSSPTTPDLVARAVERLSDISKDISSTSSAADESASAFFDQHFDQAFWPLQRVEAVLRSRTTSPPTNHNFNALTRVKGVCFCELKTVHYEKKGSVLTLEEKDGITHVLELPSEVVSLRVWEAIVDSLNHSLNRDGRANWTSLNAVLNAERRVMRVGGRASISPVESLPKAQRVTNL